MADQTVEALSRGRLRADILRLRPLLVERRDDGAPPRGREQSFRVVRTRRRDLRWSSSSETLRLTVGSGMPSFLLAAEKLPVSTVATKICIASKRSIR